MAHSRQRIEDNGVRESDNIGTPRPLSSVMEDWSGRGPHVDFRPEEALPLHEGRFLGHGVMGGVYETHVEGHAFAWKRRFCRRQIGKAERKEIEILKKLKHEHIVRIVGTYTHRQFLGLLLHPVAVCDLATLFEDIEERTKKDKEGFLFRTFGRAVIAGSDGPKRGADMSGLLSSAAEERFSALRIALNVSTRRFLNAVYRYLAPKIGCIVSAVEYLHSVGIRHKDLKPSNILLGPHDKVWLTDFGSATDFSELSVSRTANGERGTLKYCAPEVAEYLPSGRAADIFSLGCVLLEMHAILPQGTLKRLSTCRSAFDGSFQANLDQIRWSRLLDYDSYDSCCDPTWLYHMLVEVRQMLNKDPTRRPKVSQIRSRLNAIDILTLDENHSSCFGNCCRTADISLNEYKATLHEEMRVLPYPQDTPGPMALNFPLFPVGWVERVMQWDRTPPQTYYIQTSTGASPWDNDNIYDYFLGD